MLPQTRLYTPEEYLALEEKSPVKSEYYRGRIYQMTGATINHNRIVFNLSGLFFQALNGKSCEGFNGDMRLLVKANGLYTYPDLMVVCGPVDLVIGRKDTLTNPILIIEVLSDSTDQYDRTDKFDLYKGLDSLQNYVLVDQHRPYIQVFRRLETEPHLWVLENFSGLESQVPFPALDLTLNLADIYKRVEWPEPETKPEHPQQPQ
jgi:Uma2 family endonuclease